MPAIDLAILQFGKETTWGVAVAATAKLMGVTEAALQPVDKVAAIADLGTLAPSRRSVQVGQHGEGTFSLALSYEDALYPLHGLFGAVDPTGAGPYTWAYAAPVDAAPTMQPFTVEYGATGASYRLAGALIPKATLTIAVGDVWRLTKAALLGKAISPVTLAALADRTVELVRAADTKLYLDEWAGNIGTTEVQAALIKAELALDTGRHLKYFNAFHPLAYGEARWAKSPLKLTLEFGATAKALVDSLLTPLLVQRQIRLKATSGTKSLQVDYAGTLTSGYELFKDRDGNMIVELNFEGEYNSNLGNWLEVTVVNSVSALP